MRSLILLALSLGCSSRPAPDALAEAVAAERAALEGSSEPPAAAPGSPVDLAGPIAAAVPASNRFGVDLYRQLITSKPTENTFFSPASVSVALTMTSAGAAGPTLEAMRSTLHLPERGIHEGFGALMKSWNQPGQGHELNVANRVWVQEGFALEEPFTAVLTEHYQAGLGRADFANPDAKDPINRWVEEQTRDRIRDLIPAGVLDKDTRVVLTNAIYFNGTWRESFDKAATRPLPFMRGDGTSVEVPTMTRTGAVQLHRDPAFSVIALPYTGDGVEFVAVIPAAVDGLAAIEANLSAAALDGWLSRARPVPVELYLPRMKLATSEGLMGPLAALGMKIAMSSVADFSAMSTQAPMQIDEVLHKAFLKLDEEGTEAAAATAVVVGIRSAGSAPEPPEIVRVDRPFLFGLRDVRTGAWLFLGRIVDPAGLS